MTVNDLITLINLEAGDLLDEDTDNIAYINQALDFLGFQLAAMGDPTLIATATVTDDSNVPVDFVALLPRNGYPIQIRQNKIKILSDDESVEINYTVNYSHVHNVTDTIPAADMYADTLVLITAYLIKKKTYIPTEYCAEDKQFVSEVLTAIKAAKGIV